MGITKGRCVNNSPRVFWSFSASTKRFWNIFLSLSHKFAQNLRPIYNMHSKSPQSDIHHMPSGSQQDTATVHLARLVFMFMSKKSECRKDRLLTSKCEDWQCMASMCFRINLFHSGTLLWLQQCIGNITCNLYYHVLNSQITACM
jgi:hypothetical protein